MHKLLIIKEAILRFMESFDLQQWTGIGAMKPRGSVLDCANPVALSSIHDFQSARGLAQSKTLRRLERFMERVFWCA